MGKSRTLNVVQYKPDAALAPMDPAESQYSIKAPHDRNRHEIIGLV